MSQGSEYSRNQRRRLSLEREDPQIGSSSSHQIDLIRQTRNEIKHLKDDCYHYRAEITRKEKVLDHEKEGNKQLYDEVKDLEIELRYKRNELALEKLLSEKIKENHQDLQKLAEKNNQIRKQYNQLLIKNNILTKKITKLNEKIKDMKKEKKKIYRTIRQQQQQQQQEQEEQEEQEQEEQEEQEQEEHQ